MSTGIEITPRERDRGRAVRIRSTAYARLKQIAKDSGRDMVEVLDLAIAQVVVAGRRLEAPNKMADDFVQTAIVLQSANQKHRYKISVSDGGELVATKLIFEDGI